MQQPEITAAAAIRGKIRKNTSVTKISEISFEYFNRSAKDAPRPTKSMVRKEATNTVKASRLQISKKAFFRHQAGVLRLERISGLAVLIRATISLKFSD